MKKRPGICIDLRYFISYVDTLLVIELFSTHYGLMYHTMLPLDRQPNTPYGLLERPNCMLNLSSVFVQCQQEHKIYVANQKQIMAACMRYVSQHVHDNIVVNYLLFVNQDTYTRPQYSQTYSALFSPKHLVVNVSRVAACLEDIDMLGLFKYLRASYQKTGRHIHDIQSIDYSVNTKNTS